MSEDIENKIGADKQSAQMVKQAIKDDQALSAVAKDIHVTVKEGTVTLDGKVSTEQQLNLATNTASAVAVDEKVKNHMEVTNNK
jgi:osmotically-inducible protein OsmY